MITEEVKTGIAAIIGDEAIDVVVEVIIADEDDVEEVDGDEVELYKMDIWIKMVMMIVITEIEEQVSLHVWYIQ